ncbi:MAG: hypothetical protein JKY26_06495 [Pseudomonas sp.]|nr:hypothetical protein [Pseudomonas sp.]
MTDKPERMEIWLAEDQWPDNQSVIKAEDYDSLAAQSAADKARIAGLTEALGSMTCAYRMAVQAGHARITALGGECDSVDRMLSDFPDYGRSVELYKSCRATLATHRSNSHE